MFACTNFSQSLWRTTNDGFIHLGRHKYFGLLCMYLFVEFKLGCSIHKPWEHPTNSPHLSLSLWSVYRARAGHVRLIRVTRYLPSWARADRRLEGAQFSSTVAPITKCLRSESLFESHKWLRGPLGAVVTVDRRDRGRGRPPVAPPKGKERNSRNLRYV